MFLGKAVDLTNLCAVVSTLIEWHEARMLYMKTKRLDGTDTLRSMPADVRRDAIVIFVADHGEPLAIVVPDRITIGRRGGGYVRRPHVDLDRHGAFEKAGVCACMPRFIATTTASTSKTWTAAMAPT